MFSSVTHCIKLIYLMIQQMNFFRENTCWNVLGGRFGQITHSGPSWTEKRCSCGIIWGFFINFFIIWLFFCIFLHNWIFFNFWRCFSTISWKSKVWKSIIILTFYLYKVMYHNLWFLVGESISRNFLFTCTRICRSTGHFSKCWWQKWWTWCICHGIIGCLGSFWPSIAKKWS